MSDTLITVVAIVVRQKEQPPEQPEQLQDPELQRRIGVIHPERPIQDPEMVEAIKVLQHRQQKQLQRLIHLIIIWIGVIYRIR